jgi:hypothetical protein
MDSDTYSAPLHALVSARLANVSPCGGTSTVEGLQMNKTFLIAWADVFIIWMAGSFLVHGVLLHADYAKLPGLFRSENEAQQYFPLTIGAHVIMAGAFTWIYSRGAEARPWIGQGLRFGAAVSLLTVVPWYTIYYVVQPMPGIHVIKQIVFGGILVLILAAVVAFAYRDRGNRK